MSILFEFGEDNGDDEAEFVDHLIERQRVVTVQLTMGGTKIIGTPRLVGAFTNRTDGTLRLHLQASEGRRTGEIIPIANDYIQRVTVH